MNEKDKIELKELQEIFDNHPILVEELLTKSKLGERFLQLKGQQVIDDMIDKNILRVNF